jgi:hypothetical protein
MTLKREIQLLEQARNVSPDSFQKHIGIAFRSASTDARAQKIAKHFHIPVRDIENIIKASFNS